LYFFPLPQGQGSFRPTLAACRRYGCGSSSAMERLYPKIAAADSAIASVSSAIFC
jgi:hypothetical protein